MLGLSAVPLACGFDENGSLPVQAGGAAGSGGTAGAGGAGGTGGTAGAGGMGGTGGGGVMCAPGETRPCYSGPAATEGVGLCKAGTEVCGDNGMEWSTCEGQVVPASAENCSLPGDEDCNGLGDADEAVCCTPTFDDCTTPADEDCDGTAIAMCTGAPLGSFSPPGKISAPMDDTIFDVAVAPDGGYVIAGVIDGTLDNDFFTVSAGSAYVAKFDAAGVKQWERAYPATAYGVVRALDIDTGGNVILVGEFSGTIDFGGDDLTTPSPGADIFVVKLDAMGMHVWSKRFGTTSTQTAQGVAVNGDGNLFVTGYIRDDEFSFGGDSFNPGGNDDIYVVSFDADGTHRWSRAFITGGDQRAWSVAVTKDGHPVIVGQTSSNVNLGGSSNPGYGSNQDGIIAVYDKQDGAHLWSKFVGPSNDQNVNHVAIAPNGNVLVTGRFAGSVDFGSDSINVSGSTDTYFAEFNAADGAPVRGKRIGSTNTETRGIGVAADGAGHIILTGRYSGGMLDVDGQVLPAPNGTDAFVVKLAGTDLLPLWAKALGGAGNQFGWDLGIDEKGTVIVVGGFYTELELGNPLEKLTTMNGADLFSVRLAP
ncbi:SBBP repeat-containing protein [Polyangium jinanense]|uniref:SBBP repeat-containing protein n=1 Tax=Polyangium jinanense TaxID=2829994 RepID=UPI0023423018|nr:SBBP repeat-containing protein [Polyangium jinanense]MDC3953541.1 SBBP repeat-containing protein [Polyangium jinanense]